MRVSFDIETIALEQLHCAIGLFLEQRFVPAITLAGAAEEIYGKAVARRNHRHAMKLIWDFVSLRNPAGKTEKQVADECNRVKNALKHQVHGLIEFDPKLEAFLLVTRAIENYLRLGKTKTGLMNQFNESTKNFG